MPFNINKYNLFLNRKKHGTGVMKYANGHKELQRTPKKKCVLDWKQ